MTMTTTAGSGGPLRGRLLRVAAAASLILGISLATAAPAMAVTPVTTVHTEHVKAGPYDVTVGFSTWPLRAMQSLDFTFSPTGGIAGKHGTLIMHGPGIQQQDEVTPLVRHPRMPTDWGLDVTSLDAAGNYTIGFDITGPKGTGHGTLAGLTVLPQPGPPLGLSWAVCSLPFVALLLLIGFAWRRVRPRPARLAL
jgi:hypothetical protein